MILVDVDPALGRDRRHMTVDRADQGGDRGQDRVKPFRDALPFLVMFDSVYRFIYEFPLHLINSKFCDLFLIDFAVEPTNFGFNQSS